MIACIIEFAVREGQERQREALLAAMMKAVVTIDGFVSKETFVEKDNPSRLITISYWRDANALRAWTEHQGHVAAVELGKRKVFASYRIEISEVQRTIDWSYESEVESQ